MTSPKLTAAALKDVQITDGFWAPKLAVWRETTLPDVLTKFEQDGVFDNFAYVAKGEAGAKHKALPWFDGLIYETIGAAADFMQGHPDPALKARLDGYIDQIAAAAARDPEGFINTYTQLAEPTHRWGQNGGNDRWQHDLYNLGCLVEAGVHYYNATGETKLLHTAVRAANLMCKTMGPAPKQNIVPGHAISEEAFVRLAELLKAQPALGAKLNAAGDAPTDPAAYLALSQFWLDARGNHAGRENFGSYNQDHAPALKQETMEGHAVRAPLMALGMSALGAETEQPAYTAGAYKLWENMVGRRMYLTGGVGSFAADEKFGPDFALPNTGYAETCAAVASGLLSHEVNLVEGDATAADELERVLYNGALSGVSLKGTSYFYENPLESGRSRTRWNWHPCPCCPPMFLKLMARLPSYIYASDDAGNVYVNLFVGSKAKLSAGGKGEVELITETRYPRGGNLSVTVNPAGGPRAFGVKVRVPGWARGVAAQSGLYSARPAPAPWSVSVNGEPVAAPVVDSGYVTIPRTWKAGDKIALALAMPIVRVKADERVEADRGRVAVAMGPLVYCAEGADNGGSVADLVLPPDAPVSAAGEMEELGGALVLEAKGRRVDPDKGEVPATIRLIPYYANANRGGDEMRVWLAESAAVAIPRDLAMNAKASASHKFERDTFAALNDGAVPSSSGDESRHRFTWWDHRGTAGGTAEWVQYDFARPTKVGASEVYWWDETKLNRDCRVPANWRLQYRAADGSWKPVEGATSYGTAVDRFNAVRFTPVETTALRMEVVLQEGWSAGVLQWRVGGTATAGGGTEQLRDTWMPTTRKEP